MHRDTVGTYEARALDWESRRSPRFVDEATRFGQRISATPGAAGIVADLGCGPGWYSAALPAPVVAMDAAVAMARRVAVHAPDAMAVVGDLEALPFAQGSLAAAWAHHSYVHLARDVVPMALADLHRAIRVGGAVALFVFEGDGEGADVFPDDDVPGRFFSQWRRNHLLDVVAGAGFVVDEVVQREHGLGVYATRARTLADHVGPGMRLLLVGLNPSLYAADAGVGFARPGNRFWPAALQAGLVSRPRDPVHALLAHGVGMTDLVKRATVGAAELTRDEYADGLRRVERLAEWLQPGAVCFLGLAGYRAGVDRRATAGPQPSDLGGRPVYVMPNPSGLNAHARVDDLAAHLAAAAALAG
jgi:TDG/mug DNA glycosylase family protein